VDEKSFYQGYTFFSSRYAVDIRKGTGEEPYSGCIFASNMLSFKCVSWPYSFLGMHDKLENEISRNMMDALEDEQHKYHENSLGRKHNDFLVEFSKGQELSSKLIYGDTGENEELGMEFVEL
jgi:hypothetical protein